MATSTSFAAFAGRIGRYQAAAARIPAAQVRALRANGKALFDLEVRAATGGDARLSNVGANGAGLGVTTSVLQSVDGAAVRFKAAGPWQLVEYPIARHIIASKRFGGPRAGRGDRAAAVNRRLAAGYRGMGRRSAVLSTPYGPRMFVRHPGVSNPKKPWSRGETRVLAAAPRLARDVAYREIHKAT